MSYENFLDTSAILNGGLTQYKDIVLCPFIFMELEAIKTNKNKTAHVQFSARQAIAQLLELNNNNLAFVDNKIIKKYLSKYNFLLDITDHHLLIAADYYGHTHHTIINFITSDSAQYLFANKLPHLKAVYFANPTQRDLSYIGWTKYSPNAAEMAYLYENFNINSLKCHTNEFIKIYENNDLKDILFWTGETYRHLNYHELKNKFLNMTIRPLNVEQKMAFDLLQNNRITVKLLVGAAGTGKDFIMTLHALDLLQRGEIDKIVFVRNLIPFKDAPEIGFLAGDLQQKISWGLGPLRNVLGEEGLQEYEDQGLIEAVNFGFIRGCSWDNSIIYCSEGQNLTSGGYKLLVSRCGKNSQLWVNGDILQTDEKKFEEDNGLRHMINYLKGNKLFGMVKLMKSERSDTAALADLMD